MQRYEINFLLLSRLHERDELAVGFEISRCGRVFYGRDQLYGCKYMRAGNKSHSLSVENLDGEFIRGGGGMMRQCLFD